MLCNCCIKAWKVYTYTTSRKDPLHILASTLHQAHSAFCCLLKKYSFFSFLMNLLKAIALTIIYEWETLAFAM